MTDNWYDTPIGATFDLTPGRCVSGSIILHENDTSYASITKIFYDGRLSIPDNYTLLGFSEKGYVSLLNCCGGSFGTPGDDLKISPRTRGSFSTSLSLRSGCAVFGREHVCQNDQVVRAIHCTFPNIRHVLSIAHHNTAFGHLIQPHRDVLDAIRQHAPHYELHDERAHVTFFTGAYALVDKIETVLGTMQVLRGLRIDTSRGIKMKDDPYIALSFGDNPVTIGEATHRARVVCQFLGWIAGQELTSTDIRVTTSTLPGRHDALRVFLPSADSKPHQEKDHDDGLEGVLVNATQNPENFKRVVKKWLERNRKRQRASANHRFFAPMRGLFNQPLEDRVCSAANTFEYISDSSNILNAARKRAKVVLRGNLLQLPRLNDVIESAVNCRHYYTHAQTSKETHGANYDDPRTIYFLTETLRFVYGIAELLDCDWDIRAWLANPLNDRHPAGFYLCTYEENLTKFLKPR
jgi:hypothetical protein